LAPTEILLENAPPSPPRRRYRRISIKAPGKHLLCVSRKASFTLAYRHNSWLTLHISQSLLERHPLIPLNIQSCFVYTTWWKLLNYHEPSRKNISSNNIFELARTYHVHVRHNDVRIWSRGSPATARTTSLRPNEQRRAIIG
jgi:hypothetical protein